MREIIDAIGNRIRSPVWGNFLLSILIVNWNHFLVLLFSNRAIESRVADFKSAINITEFLLIPIGLAICISIAAPFASLIGAWLSYWPKHKARMLQLRSDGYYEDEKQRLDISRRKKIAEVETQLIGQAKRDEEVESISNDELRHELRSEIDKLRQSTLHISPPTPSLDYESDPANLHIGKESQKLLRRASNSKEGQIRHLRLLSGTHFSAGDWSSGELSDPKLIANYEDAIEELGRNGLIKDRTGKGQVYSVTKNGYEYVSTLSE